jgi:iron complex transport system ATP-binding protein
MIDVSNVSVSIGKKPIVKKASIHIDDGELVGLIGPNGSGKSTLLKAIYRTLEYQGGMISIDGKLIDDMTLKESALKTAVVSQHNYYNFDFTVQDVVMMGRTPHKSSMEMDNMDDLKIAYDSLQKVNMFFMKDRKFSSLSGGEQQRIILARALTQQTPCLILDEPTNHLDIKYQLESLDVVKSLGATVLCALHDMNLAAQYCDRIYLLYNGEIAAEGTPEEVITEENILKYYGVKSSVEKNVHTGLLNVVYFPQHANKQ